MPLMHETLIKKSKWLLSTLNLVKNNPFYKILQGQQNILDVA